MLFEELKEKFLFLLDFHDLYVKCVPFEKKENDIGPHPLKIPFICDKISKFVFGCVCQSDVSYIVRFLSYKGPNVLLFIKIPNSFGGRKS